MIKVCIVGVTGLVGKEILKILEEEKSQNNSLIPNISQLLKINKIQIIPVGYRSINKSIEFDKQIHKVISIDDALSLKPDITIFSAGSQISLKYAPIFAKYGYVIDNSSAWRMSRDIKLVIPEINIDILTKKDRIIANPNCSTIQMLIALYPIYKKYGIKRIVVSTYQSVTGGGKSSVDQLQNERNLKKNLNQLDHNQQYNKEESCYEYPIDLNLIPHIGTFLNNGYTTEENKMINETKKILNDKNIKITSTCVRVPTIGAHAESINIELEKEYDLDSLKKLLVNSPGCKLIDDYKQLKYPMPSNVINSNFVYIGRIRRDDSMTKSLNLWVVADNIRKGAATNALQVCNYLIKDVI